MATICQSFVAVFTVPHGFRRLPDERGFLPAAWAPAMAAVAVGVCSPLARSQNSRRSGQPCWPQREETTFRKGTFLPLKQMVDRDKPRWSAAASSNALQMHPDASMATRFLLGAVPLLQDLVRPRARADMFGELSAGASGASRLRSPLLSWAGALSLRKPCSSSRVPRRRQGRRGLRA